MKRALLHSGGNAKGAVALPILEGLIQTHGLHNYHMFCGTSVGAINMPEVSAGRLSSLYGMYEEIDGLSWYLRTKMPWNWGTGITSLDRLWWRSYLYGSKLNELKIPVSVGIFDYVDKKHFMLSSSLYTDDKRWIAARMASASIPIIMSGWKLAERNMHLCYDGGVRHIVPLLDDWETYDAIDVIICTPLEDNDVNVKFSFKNPIKSFTKLLGTTIDIFLDGILIQDLQRLQYYANHGIKVTIYSPQFAGNSFDASASTIKKRIEAGKIAWENPIILNQMEISYG